MVSCRNEDRLDRGGGGETGEKRNGYLQAQYTDVHRPQARGKRESQRKKYAVREQVPQENQRTFVKRKTQGTVKDKGKMIPVL